MIAKQAYADRRRNDETASAVIDEINERKRRHMEFLRIVSLLGLIALAGCGTAVGAGAGGLAGSQFGHGKGKTAATLGGVIGGGVLGHAVTGD